MKLVRHLLAADVRRFRSTIAAWIVLVVIITGLEAMRPGAAGNPALSEWIGVTATLLWLAELLFFPALVASVVQLHLLVGTTAFWFARPIPARTLFASKASLLFVLLVAVPVACDVALMLPYRVPLSRMLLVALQGIVIRSTVAGVLACAAALTSSLTRFAVVCIGALAGAALVSGLGLTALLSRADGPPGQVLYSGGLISLFERLTDWTPEVLAALVVVAGCAALLDTQYRRRSVRRSLSVAAAGIAAAVIVPGIWPWPIFVPRQSTPDWAWSVPVLTVDSSPFRIEAVRPVPGGPRYEDAWRVVNAKAQMSAPPPSWLATASLAGATLEAAGVGRLASEPYRLSNSLAEGPLSPQGPSRRILQDVIGVNDVEAIGVGAADRHAVFVARQGALEDFVGKNAAYDGRFRIDLTELRLAGALPLERGASFQDGDYRFQIDDVRAAADDDGVSVRTRISRTRTVFDRRPPVTYLPFLRNLERRRAIHGFAGQLPYRNVFQILSAPWFSSGFTLFTQMHRFSVPEVRRDIAKGVASDWLAKAELVIVKAIGEGTVTRRVDIPNARVEFLEPPKQQRQ